MKLFKSRILWAAALVGIVSTSCSLNDDKMEQTLSSMVSQMVIPDDATKDVVVKHQCLYTLNMDLNARTAVISAGSLDIEGVKGAFQSDVMKFQYALSSVGESYYFPNSGSGMFGSNTPVTDIKGYLTSVMPNFNRQPMLVMSYRVPGATVKTFSKNPVFAGRTTTKYPAGPGGAEATSTTDEATYGVVFADDMKTATVVIYNIKFAPSMPKTLEAVMLKNLTVSVDRNGYTITGADIIPDVVEGGSTTPYTNFPFASFSLSTTNEELTAARCDYTVNAEIKGMKMVFKGEFEGVSAECVRIVGAEK